MIGNNSDFNEIVFDDVEMGRSEKLDSKIGHNQTMSRNANNILGIIYSSVQFLNSLL